MTIGMIGISNWNTTIINGYTQGINTARIILSEIIPSSITSSVETSLVISLVITNWNQFTTKNYSSVKSLVLPLHQVYAQLLLLKKHPNLLAQLIQVYIIKINKNNLIIPHLRILKDINLTVIRVL